MLGVVIGYFPYYTKPPSALEKIDIKFDVDWLRDSILMHEERWDTFNLRTNHPQSPHREMSDMFLRYNARENFTGDRAAFNERHDSVWWPDASLFPEAKEMTFDLMRHVEGEQLGMVLLTRLPAGKECYTHTDQGWHARHYDKYAIQIASNEDQYFYVGDDRLVAMPGECYRFDNSKPHGVVNNSDEDRITMIVCIRNRFTGRVSCQ